MGMTRQRRIVRDLFMERSSSNVVQKYEMGLEMGTKGKAWCCPAPDPHRKKSILPRCCSPSLVSVGSRACSFRIIETHIPMSKTAFVYIV